MKTLLTLMPLLVLSSFSTSSFAGPYQINNAVKNIHGPTVMSKEEAYQIGLSLINQYNNKSSKELSKKLSSRFDDVDSQSFMIKNAKVKVDEFLQSNGKITYQPILNISYEFKKRELGN